MRFHKIYSNDFKNAKCRLPQHFFTMLRNDENVAIPRKKYKIYNVILPSVFARKSAGLTKQSIESSTELQGDSNDVDCHESQSVSCNDTARTLL